MLVPPAGQSAFRDSHRTKGWQSWLASEAGRGRRMEDAWRVAAGAPMAGTVWDAFAVFDGLGGRANGQEAAWTAARALPEAMAAADGPASLLRTLNPAVRASGGAATAAVFLADRLSDEAWLLGVGDCSAYRLSGGRAVSVLPHDRAGRHLVTDCLGSGFREGRAFPIEVRPGEALLLCTDGVEEAFVTASLPRALQAGPEEAQGALEGLLAEARAMGSTDDATALLARRA
jgi:serine/threonine protein phosphatase PrpC